MVIGFAFGGGDGYVAGPVPAVLDELMLLIRPGHLQMLAQRGLDPAERDEEERRWCVGVWRITASYTGIHEMNNFTPRAQQVLQLARKEADRFNHGYVGTEHLLLGLIALGQGVAVNVSATTGRRIGQRAPRGGKGRGHRSGNQDRGQRTVHPAGARKKVLALAGSEARALD